MKTIFVSAFGQYGVYLSNSSEETVKMIRFVLKNRLAPGIQVATEVLPATAAYLERGSVLWHQADYYNASAVVALGMASEKRGLCIETRVRNLFMNDKHCPEFNGLPVNSRYKTGQTLDLNLAPWNIKEFQKKCAAAGIPTEISADAGGFCCNALAWQMRLEQINDLRLAKIPFIFMHIPCSPNCIRMDETANFERSGRTTLCIERVLRGLRFLIEGATIEELPPRESESEEVLPTCR